MTTFVLVHGAWSGGWYWNKIVPLLRAAGHVVYTPTLTGLGERSHLFTQDIDLFTHIRDIVNVLTFEDLTDVALVGHSYSGMVIAGVADRVGHRLGHLIYVDAFLPEDGESMVDCTVGMTDDVIRTVPESATEFGLLSPGDIAWIAPKLGVQPRRTFNQRLRLFGRASPATHNAFVHTSEGFDDFAQRARRRGYTIRTFMEANHNPMITRPVELTAILNELVSDQLARARSAITDEAPDSGEASIGRHVGAHPGRAALRRYGRHVIGRLAGRSDNGSDPRSRASDQSGGNIV